MFDMNIRGFFERRAREVASKRINTQGILSFFERGTEELDNINKHFLQSAQGAAGDVEQQIKMLANAHALMQAVHLYSKAAHDATQGYLSPDQALKIVERCGKADKIACEAEGTYDGILADYYNGIENIKGRVKSAYEATGKWRTECNSEFYGLTKKFPQAIRLQDLPEVEDRLNALKAEYEAGEETYKATFVSQMQRGIGKFKGNKDYKHAVPEEWMNGQS